MSFACPYCKAVLNPKGLKPGRFQPKCPKCAEVFVLVVPDDPTGTISVQQVAAKQPVAGPDTDRAPRPAPATAKAVAKPKPKPKLTQEEVAALLLEGKDPADFGELPGPDEPGEPDEPTEDDPNATVARGNLPAPAPAAKINPAPAPKPAPKPKHDPNATGDFTEPDAAPPAPKKPAAKPVAEKKPAAAKTPARTVVQEADPNATGDFTEPDATPPAKKTAPKPAAKKVDPNVTGDFTAADDPDASPPVGEATGAFTSPGQRNEDEGTENDEPAPPKPRAGKGKLKPNQTVKGGVAAEEDELDASDVADVAPPRLGGYEVLKVLGKGGMGAVLLGRQLSLDRRVAIKVMHPKIAQNPSFVARFTREAYAAAQLTHHNVVQIYDIGEDAGHHFFSMEFVPGQSLMQLVKQEGKLAPDVAVGYVLQAARGLRYGHNQGMVHRDIKPDNLMLNTEGIVKVADLGLVKLASGELPEQAGALPSGDDEKPGDTNLTRAGAVMGTPAYMAPEQATDSGTVDQRADIYALGCTLYVLVTGKPPFDGKTALEIISKHQTEPVTPPEVVVKRVPKQLSVILLKMMAKKPADRYQSMDEVIAALEGFLGVERAGTFNPKEEQADQLERCAHQYQFRSKAKLKKTLAIGFFVACFVGIVGAAVAGMGALAGGLLGLALMTPVAYFVFQGILSGSVVFTRVRGVVFGMRFFDWLMIVGGGLLLLLTLFLFGFLWAWLGFAVLAAALGGALWFLTDRAAAGAQGAPLEEARRLLKSLRLGGLDEEAVRQFVCKFAGPHWEQLYEALFGYEALIAARASRKGDTGETWHKFATWRDPIVQWADAKFEARRLAKERALLQKVEAKALVAEGVSQAEAKAQAQEMADQMVDQAEEAQKARKEGKEADVRALVAAARERRRPQPGMTIAGKKHRDLWFKHAANDWLGPRLRLALGAILFAAGILWMYQNNLLEGEKALNSLTSGDLGGAQQAATATSKAATKPLAVPGDVVPIPDELKPSFNTWALPATGLLVLLNGLWFFGWRPTLVTVPGALVAVFGPVFGVPVVDPLTAQQLSLIIGAVLIGPVAWALRQ